MPNVARDLLWPTSPEILARIVFLYVGQGSSTIILAADGDSYRVLLLDIHLDEALGGVNVPALITDLLSDGRLDVFVNSHPHNDHLRGVAKLHGAVPIDTIWHSGHVPSKDHEQAYQQLQAVIDAILEEGGSEEELRSSRTPRLIGDMWCYLLAPAQHVQDAIDDETPEARDGRIHEYCAVLRVGAGETWVMLPGDADRDAWEQHITDYWSDEGKIQASILSAPHHGSRTFFKHDESDEPYVDALQAIEPTYVVISAPKRTESPHGHPHEDAVELYTAHAGKDNLLHTGDDRHSFICDIYRDGQYQIVSDDGALASEYGLEDDDGDGGGQKSRWERPTITFPGTRVDGRPMGQS